MTRLGIRLVLAISLLITGGARSVAADGSEKAPDFQEVLNLIRTHATGLGEAELNRAAVQGLVGELGSRVALIGEDNPEDARATEPLLSRMDVLADDLGYFRISRVAAGLGDAIRAGFDEIQQTNKLVGIVLDLRYATGQDYAAAVAVADLFCPDSVPLLDFGSGVVRAQPKSNAIQVPIAILVNSETAGAPEALAATLRANGTGLILGSSTAGEALIAREFPLQSGDRLRIATAPVALGDGTRLPSDGVKPDIDVAVAPALERAYFADSFYIVPQTNLVAAAGNSGTNTASTARRVRLNEAELVREHRQNFSRTTNAAPRVRDVEPESPVVSDPALARALDLLKGLAVVRRTRS